MKKRNPIVEKPVVDRLGFVLPWAVDLDDDQAQLVADIRGRVDSAIRADRCELAYPKGPRYRLSFRIKLSNSCKVLVQVGALQPRVQKGGIRILLNPSKFAAGDVELLHRTLRRIIGSNYDLLMQEPLINVLDIAVDIFNVNLNRLLVTYTNAQRHTIFGKTLTAGTTNVETYNFGSASSDYMTAAYDKRMERVDAAIKAIARKGLNQESLKSNFLKKFKVARGSPERLRVEVRGRKMRGCRLFQLPLLSNRFSRFSFTDLDSEGSGLSPKTEAAFIAMCQQFDVKTAFALFKDTGEARAVRKYWRTRQVDWWQPEHLWQQGFDALQEVGLFPARAFKDVSHLAAASIGLRRVQRY
jgi:hypothetical protein